MINFQLGLSAQFEKQKQLHIVDQTVESLIKTQHLTKEGEETLIKMGETMKDLVGQYFTHKTIIKDLLAKDLGIE